MNGRSGCFVQTRYPLFLLHCGGILSYNGKETGGRSMKIYFVRHGETDMNARNMFYGWYDADINEKVITCGWYHGVTWFRVCLCCSLRAIVCIVPCFVLNVARKQEVPAGVPASLFWYSALFSWAIYSLSAILSLINYWDNKGDDTTYLLSISYLHPYLISLTYLCFLTDIFIVPLECTGLCTLVERWRCR